VVILASYSIEHHRIFRDPYESGFYSLGESRSAIGGEAWTN
jgi:hypothetical protein